VARTVFKIAEAVVRRLVGSIPTRSRHVHGYALRDKAFLTRTGSDHPLTIHYAPGRRWLPLAAQARVPRPALLLSHDVGR
jgi:hypothetical protein